MIVDTLLAATLLLIVAAATASGLYALARRKGGPVRSAERIWARALLLGPIGWILIELAARGAAPWLYVPGKALIVWAFVDHLQSLRQIRGAPLRPMLRALPIASVALATIAHLLWFGARPMGTGLVSMLSAVLALLCLREVLLERLTRSGSALSMIAVAFAASAAVLLLRSAEQWLPLSLWWTVPWASASQNLLLGLAILGPQAASLGFVLWGSDRLLDALETVANTDALTGLANRRALLQRASLLLTASKRRGTDCAVMIIDVDHFKRINDVYGHDNGDRALQCIAASLRAALGEAGLIGRIGGEEFCVIVPDASPAAAEDIGNKLSRAVQEARFQIYGAHIPLAVSIGLTTLRDSSDDLSAMMRRADQAMFGAKRAGRDRLHLSVADGSS